MPRNLPDGLAVPNTRSKPKPSSKPKPRPRPSPSSSSGPSRNPPMPPPSMPVSSGPVQSITPTRPKPPNINSYLAGDDVYQQSRRGSERTLKDFLSELDRRRGEATTTFGQTKESMQSDRTRQLAQMRDEFASRGLIHSGLFGQEQGRFEEDFAKQLQTLEQQQAALIADLMSQQTGFKREQQLAMELARQEALARRAERYGLA